MEIFDLLHFYLKLLGFHFKITYHASFKCWHIEHAYLCFMKASPKILRELLRLIEVEVTGKITTLNLCQNIRKGQKPLSKLLKRPKEQDEHDLYVYYLIMSLLLISFHQVILSKL